MPLLKQDGTLMTHEEVDECQGQLEGVAVPQIERCPDFTVTEVLRLEHDDRAVWDDSQPGDNGRKRAIRLFVCLVLDAIYRDCHFSSVAHLWDVMVASDRQYSSLYGEGCRVSDALVTMSQLRQVMYKINFFKQI